mgnify:FL=1
MLSEMTVEELFRRYDAPHGIVTMEEFTEDAMRIVFVGKLFARYVKCKDMNSRLLINHIVVL